MIAAARSMRLVPLVVVAATCLLALKTVGLIADGTYSLGSPRQAQAGDGLEPSLAPVTAEPQPRRSWAQEILGYPEYTASVAKADEKDSAKPDPKAVPAGAPNAPADGKSRNGPTTIDLDRPMPSAGERAVLESLNQRRQELEARARELDLRESLLKAAEKKVETRLSEVKEIEGRIAATVRQKDEAELARFKSLVSMYENMKAKDAAKIFDRLELRILVEVASQINPRRMSDILAQMSPEAAERLTVEIASRSGAIARSPTANELPKIEGRPNGT